MIRITGMKLLPAMLLAVSIMLPAAASAEGIYDHISGTIAGSDLAPGQPYFDQKHDASWVAPALGRLSGQAMGDSVSNGEAIAMIQAQLASLPEVAVMQNKMAELPIPQWYLTGYRDNQPTKLAKSRYMNGVLDGSLEMEPDIAALYGFWCCYDAEWFVLSSDPELRAWLGAVMLSYADDWQRLDSESAESLHNRLVKPIQTKDEPYREIDNWIHAFKSTDGVFLKPKVRDVLVQEFVYQSGMQSDERYFSQRGWDSFELPGPVGISKEDFMLMTALVLEFAPQLAADPATPQQIGWFREFLVRDSA
ncbi:MAG: hypothetical protein H7A35_04580 [Planctomycetales bacterium]|nr:hypothetical protein [bacterium]UNM09333.1 MAG: hypothetical protein H7A35_04580 [Planctomycetales bacterium]